MLNRRGFIGTCVATVVGGFCNLARPQNEYILKRYNGVDVKVDYLLKNYKKDHIIHMCPTNKTPVYISSIDPYMYTIRLFDRPRAAWAKRHVYCPLFDTQRISSNHISCINKNIKRVIDLHETINVDTLCRVAIVENSTLVAICVF